jgi:beta-phosphoglucomutase-like phosphatase (HAD superfamily)
MLDRRGVGSLGVVNESTSILVDPFAVERLGVEWRLALDSAEGALTAATGMLPPHELSLRRARLVEERSATLGLLRAFARDQGVSGQFVHLTPRRVEKNLLGLPARVTACVFDLEGVLVGSVSLHRAAWTETFDEFALAHRNAVGDLIVPFDPDRDYVQYIDGRPRLEGVQTFLVSRGIRLPEGDTTDAPGYETAHALANRKNELLRRRLELVGVRAYEGSWQYLEIAREAGVHTAVVSASANTHSILKRAGLADVVEACIDGDEIVAKGLRASPAPDRLLAACKQVGAEPANTAAFETTSAGIAAAHAGQFTFVVGIRRTPRTDDLRRDGADLIVPDLADLLTQRL